MTIKRVLLLLALCLLLPAAAAHASGIPAADNTAAPAAAEVDADAAADAEAELKALCESDLFAPEELDRSLCPPGWECYSNNDCNWVCPCTGKCVACTTTSSRGTCQCYYC